MTGVSSLDQVLHGLQRIRGAIIERVRARNVPIGFDNFTWNHGQLSFAPLHDPVHMEVRVGSRHASADWPHIMVEDCCDRIEHPVVRREIERIVDALAPQSPP